MNSEDSNNMDENSNDISNVLFTNPMAICTDEHKKFSCLGCGHRFLFKSSLMAHINIKSLNMKYFCICCGISIECFNRCQFFSHIRSHEIKTAVINTDKYASKVNPLPSITSLIDENKVNDDKITKHSKYPCFECNEDIAVTGTIEKDRAQHYMQTKEMVECPVCLYKLPSACALIAHLRVHFQAPPFICCECGKHLSLEETMYPYRHDCEGFKFMKVMTKMHCFDKTCTGIMDPNNYLKHLKSCHLNKIYKCLNCNLAGYNEKAVGEHVMLCCNKIEYLTYFECQACPEYLFDSNKINMHLDKHSFNQKSHVRQLSPCWNCGLVMDNVYDFLRHHVSEHYSHATQNILINVITKVKSQVCGACQNTFWYWQDIYETPTKCFGCILNENFQPGIVEESSNQDEVPKIKCFLCKTEITESWADIMMHFTKFHKSLKHLYLKYMKSKFNLKVNKKKAIKKSGNIKVTICFNKTALEKTVKVVPEENLPLEQIQCDVCTKKFSDSNTFESHYRVHGLAFLMKKTKI